MNNTVVIYPGRFEPFAKHHAAVFLWVQKKFGKDNTYIATSNKVEKPKSPFNFNEKKAIIGVYGFNNVLESSQPYKLESYNKKFPDNISVIFVVGKKDAERLTHGKYFLPYKDGMELKPATENGYYVISPYIKLEVPGQGEMSGTSVRKYLGDTTVSREEKKKGFKEIFGWYSEKMANIIFDKLESMNENKLFSSDWWVKVLTEGGAGGHMAHVYDLPSVKSGLDLLKVYAKVKDYLKSNPAAVKIDGINASIRLIELDGKPQFVMDRGSNKVLDVTGITTDALLARFGEGHGLIKIGGDILNIFNKSIPKIKDDLIKLGLWENPNIMFNIEYVSGTTNTVDYENKFIAIHGLLEIKRVSPTKRKTVEIPYDKDALNNLIEGLAPVAKKRGYDVVGTIGTKLKGDINFNSLNQKFTINVDGKVKLTKSMTDWLREVQNPAVSHSKMFNKQTYLDVLSGKKLVDISDNEKEQKEATDTAVIFHADRLLSNDVLDKLNSALGDVKGQEGIVIRDTKIAAVPFKITGEFSFDNTTKSKFR